MELTNEVVIVEDDEVVFENLVYFLNTKSFKRQTSNVWNYFTKIGKDREGFLIYPEKLIPYPLLLPYLQIHCSICFFFLH